MPSAPLDAFELLERMQAFYEAAWSKVIWVIGALGVVVGLVIPYFAQMYQRRVFNLEAEKMKAQMRDYVEKCVGDGMAKEEEKTRLQWASFREQIDAELEAIRRQVENTGSMTYYIQGLMTQLDGYFTAAAYSFLMAIPGLIVSKDELNLRKCLEAAIDCFGKSNRKGLSVLRERYPDLENRVIKMLEESNENGRYTEDIVRLKRAIKQVEEQPGKTEA